MFWGEGRWGHVGAVTAVSREADCRGLEIGISVPSPYSSLPSAMISNTSLALEWNFVFAVLAELLSIQVIQPASPPQTILTSWRMRAGQDTWSFSWSPWTCLEDDSESLKLWPKINLLWEGDWWISINCFISRVWSLQWEITYMWNWKTEFDFFIVNSFCLETSLFHHWLGKMFCCRAALQSKIYPVMIFN